MRRKPSHRSRSATARQAARLDARTRDQLAKVEQAVDRATGEAVSRQPRFGGGVRPDNFYSSVRNWLTFADLQEPAYVPDSRKRDEWLRTFWRMEPHLAGVMNSVVALDKNRGWSVTGGRNQVYRVTEMLHDATAAPGLRGWRNYFSSQALSFYATDMGLIAETGREGRAGPLRGLFHTDSARCRLTGRSETPLEYYPTVSIPGERGLAKQDWPEDGYFRVASMPHDDEKYHGLGYCAISRCLELAKLMVAVFRKDQELLGARMPEGLLLLQGIQQTQWDQAMSDREAKLTAKERQYFGGVFVLATAGIDEIDAKLIALRQLPENFTLDTFTDMLMYAYALTFGYSPREFWPVSSGALGTATETETQDDNSTGKGESDLVLNYQEQLSNELPESILFEFDARDSKGDMEVVTILQAKAELVKSLSELTGGSGEMMEGGTDPTTGEAMPAHRASAGKLLSADQVWEKAVEFGLIPEEWNRTDDQQVTSTDVENDQLERSRHLVRSNPHIMRAIERYPQEPVIRYHYQKGRAREYVLWESREAMQKTRAWPGAGPSPIDKVARTVLQLHAVVDKASKLLPTMQRSLVQEEEEIDDMKAAQFFALLDERLRTMPGGGLVHQQPAQPMVLVQEADGTMRELRQATQPVNVVVDTTPLVEVLREFYAGAKPVDVQAIVENVIRLIPRQADVDYTQLAGALATALGNMPPPAVTVNVPEQQITNVIEMPEPRPARFSVEHDGAGRVTEIIKTPGA